MFSAIVVEKSTRLLQHDRELVAQVGEAVVAQVDAVEQDRARGRVVEAREQAHERRLAAPVRPAMPTRAPGVDVERDVARAPACPPS